MLNDSQTTVAQTRGTSLKHSDPSFVSSLDSPFQLMLQPPYGVSIFFIWDHYMQTGKQVQDGQQDPLKSPMLQREADAIHSPCTILILKTWDQQDCFWRLRLWRPEEPNDVWSEKGKTCQPHFNSRFRRDLQADLGRKKLGLLFLTRLLQQARKKSRVERKKTRRSEQSWLMYIFHWHKPPLLRMGQAAANGDPARSSAAQGTHEAMEKQQAGTRNGWTLFFQSEDLWWPADYIGNQTLHPRIPQLSLSPLIFLCQISEL